MWSPSRGAVLGTLPCPGGLGCLQGSGFCFKREGSGAEVDPFLWLSHPYWGFKHIKVVIYLLFRRFTLA